MRKRVNIYFPNEEEHEKAKKKSKEWNKKIFGNDEVNLSLYTMMLYRKAK
ncbi:MAG: hypothetical protein ACI9SG_000929 [Maribacter sp.]|jgi:hypothetical protein